MIEVLFGESEAASMKMAKGRRTVVGGAGKAENGSGTWIGGHPRQVICLGFMLDIGDIKEPVDGRYRRELIRAMYGQEQWGKQDEGARRPQTHTRRSWSGWLITLGRGSRSESGTATARTPAAGSIFFADG